MSGWTDFRDSVTGSVGTVAGAGLGFLVGGPAGALLGSQLGGTLDASKAAGKAGDAARKAASTELAFQQERYDDWKAVFGDIQTNLGDFYTNLDPETLAAQGIQATEVEANRARRNLTESLAQRGLESSGLAQRGETAIALDTAEQRATVRQEAPFKAAEAQSNFLQIGLGQDPSGDQADILRERARSTARQAEIGAAAVGQGISSAIKTGISLFGED